ncbi:MAG: hypothetical protein ABFQ95_04085 [Pseudomonadota bacterium]
MFNKMFYRAASFLIAIMLSPFLLQNNVIGDEIENRLLKKQLKKLGITDKIWEGFVETSDIIAVEDLSLVWGINIKSGKGRRICAKALTKFKIAERMQFTEPKRWNKQTEEFSFKDSFKDIEENAKKKCGEAAVKKVRSVTSYYR